MNLRKRVENLEAKTKPTEPEYPVHMYQVREGQSEDHTRENCPSCAAMSDDDYATYRKWLDGPTGGRVRVIVVRLASPRPEGETV